MILSRYFFFYLISILIPVITYANINAQTNYITDKTILIGDFVPSDLDKDGVDDSSDWCPNTPKNVAVGNYGCPLDSSVSSLDLELYFLFDKNDSNVKDQYQFNLIDIGGKMLREPNLLLIIQGYASDYRNDEKKNLELSIERANSIKKILVENFDIKPSRINIKGYGNKPFVFSKSSYVEHVLNRSVYITTSKVK